MNINEEKIQETISKIIKYIEINDYEEATLETQNQITNMGIDYTEFLSKELGLEINSIIKYAENNFNEIFGKIKQVLEERKKFHINNKTEALKNNKIGNIKDTLEEDQTPINYEDKITLIIEDKINDSINQIARTLEYLGIDQNKIDEITYEITMKRNQILKKCERISNTLIDLDKRLTRVIENIIEELLPEKEYETSEEEKFREELAVDNTGNKIEESARKNIEDIFNDSKTYEKSEHNLDPRGIF